MNTKLSLLLLRQLRQLSLGFEGSSRNADVRRALHLPISEFERAKAVTKRVLRVAVVKVCLPGCTKVCLSRCTVFTSSLLRRLAFERTAQSVFAVARAFKATHF
jgi:hypothetical protein